MTAAPASPARMPQELAQGEGRLTGPLRVIRAANAAELPAREKHALLALLGWLNYTTWRVHVGTRALARAMGCSYTTAAAALDSLDRQGVTRILRTSRGTRADERQLDLDALDALQQLERNEQPTDLVDPQPLERNDPPSAPTAMTLNRGENGLALQNGPASAPVAGTKQSEQRKAAAVAGACATPTPPKPETPPSGAAAENRGSEPRPQAHVETPPPPPPAQTATNGHAPLAAALPALPPLNPTNAPEGHVAGLAGTPWGARLLAMLTEAGCLSGEAWKLARRADFDYDLVAYLVHRAKECRPQAHDGTTESPTKHASRRSGLLRTLAKEPREGLAGFHAHTKQRHANRAAAIDAVWRWHAAQNGGERWPAESDMVAQWAERTGLGYAGPEDAKGWARHLPVTDLDLYPARQGAAGAARTWDAIVKSIKEQTHGTSI